MTARWWWAAVLAGVLAAGPNGAAAQGGGRVSGRVVRWSGAPSSGRMVHLKGHAPVTAKDGRFSLPRVPATYDLWVGHEQETRVTAYRGLTRRDPMLEHTSTWVTSRDQPPRKASVAGIVRGDFPFPLERGYDLHFVFSSPEATGSYHLSSHSEILGPRFGRMQVRWWGPASTKGRLLVLASHKGERQQIHEVYLASQPLVLADQGEAFAEMKLTRIPLGRIAGTIKVPYARGWNGSLSFRLPGGRGSIGLACSLKAGAYECQVPDLSPLGGEYCMYIIDGVSEGSEARRCGGRIGMTDFSLAIEAPPKVKLPEGPVAPDSGTLVSWAGDGRAVYVVDVRPDVALGPSQSSEKWFDFKLYTTGTRLTWKDVSDFGVKLLEGRKYKFNIARLYPFRTLDEMASRSGPWSGTAYQRAAADEVELTIGR